MARKPKISNINPEYLKKIESYKRTTGQQKSECVEEILSLPKGVRLWAKDDESQRTWILDVTALRLVLFDWEIDRRSRM